MSANLLIFIFFVIWVFSNDVPIQHEIDMPLLVFQNNR